MILGTAPIFFCPSSRIFAICFNWAKMVSQVIWHSCCSYHLKAGAVRD